MPKRLSEHWEIVWLAHDGNDNFQGGGLTEMVNTRLGSNSEKPAKHKIRIPGEKRLSGFRIANAPVKRGTPEMGGGSLVPSSAGLPVRAAKNLHRFANAVCKGEERWEKSQKKSPPQRCGREGDSAPRGEGRPAASLGSTAKRFKGGETSRRRGTRSNVGLYNGEKGARANQKRKRKEYHLGKGARKPLAPARRGGS